MAANARLDPDSDQVLRETFAQAHAGIETSFTMSTSSSLAYRVEMQTLQLAKESLPRIGKRDIAPGLIDSFPGSHLALGASEKNVGSASVARRLGTSEEIAKAVAFLAPDNASFATDHGLVADGGPTIA